MTDETDESTAEATPSEEPAEPETSGEPTAESTDADVTKRRIRTLAIFFLGVGVYAAVGAGLDAGALLAENLTTYFVSGLVLLAVGVVLLALAR